MARYESCSMVDLTVFLIPGMWSSLPCPWDLSFPPSLPPFSFPSVTHAYLHNLTRISSPKTFVTTFSGVSPLLPTVCTSFHPTSLQEAVSEPRSWRRGRWKSHSLPEELATSIGVLAQSWRTVVCILLVCSLPRPTWSSEAKCALVRQRSYIINVT